MHKPKRQISSVTLPFKINHTAKNSKNTTSPPFFREFAAYYSSISAEIQERKFYKSLIMPVFHIIITFAESGGKCRRLAMGIQMRNIPVGRHTENRGSLSALFCHNGSH